MKKLIMALAVATVAAATQAASLDWALNSKNSIYLHNGGDAASVTCFLLNVAGSDYTKLTGDLSTGTATAANITSYNSYLGQATTGASGAKLGKIGSATATVDAPGVDYSAVFVFFDTDQGKNYYYLSSASAGKSYDGSPEFPSGTAIAWDSSNFSAANFHEASAAPEPTSGLLLLLGMAGLALKRKRA